jgi:L-ascorbate metabolism protein UlaG (beta-lactamase superfamily)
MQQWSRLIGQGLNQTLWAIFMLIAPTIKVYFGGDTGYFIGYQGSLRSSYSKYTSVEMNA